MRRYEEVIKERIIEGIRVAEARKGIRDHFYFCKEILGHKDMTKRTHGRLCDILDNRRAKKYKLFLLPRGTFKTSIITLGYSIASLIRNPDIRILINSDIYDNSLKYLQQIKRILERNDKLRWLYGNLVGDKWRETDIIIRTRRTISKEPTISCGSTDVTRVGLHYDLIINDDIVNDKTIQTKEQIEKTIDFFKGQLSLLEPSGELIIVGTRWHYDDLYGYIIKNMSDLFEIYVAKAIGDNGELFFPELYDIDTLNKIKQIQGTYMFYNQYLNTPISPEDQIFKEIPTFDASEKLPDRLNITITIDPALSESKSADYTGIVVCGTDENERIYVLDAMALRVNPDELIETIFALNDKWKPSAIGIEVFSFQRVLKYYLDKRLIAEKRYVPIVELSTDTRTSKYMRIIAIQPYLQRRQMIIKSDLMDLIDQLKMFPKASNDDLIDALASQLQIYTRPMDIEEVVEQQDDDLRGRARIPNKRRFLGYDETGLLNI